MTTTFEALGVSPDLIAELADQGIDEPFAIQSLTIQDALAGRDVCGKAKTGSGKTLGFGLPLIMRTEKAEPKKPRALVLVPTRELAVQVRAVIAPLAEVRGLTTLAVYGGAPMDRQIKALQRGVDIMIATPGRLIDLGDRGELAVDDVRILVLDEADRMADMGFMPQVQWVLRRMTQEHQTLLFSATLDGDIDYIVKNHMNDPVRHEVVSTTATVDQMEHRFLKVHELDKVKVAAAIARSSYRTLIFSRTKRGCDRVCDQLKKEGVQAGALHGDLAQSVRQRALKQFEDGTLPVLVATDVAARGLHIEGVDVVIHYDPPEDEKAYLHRSGRTARAGAAGVAVSLALWNQELEVERLQKRLQLPRHFVEVFSNDPRLSDLAAWKPEERPPHANAEASAVPGATRLAQARRVGGGRGRR
ncbi:MAG TPA: DEAD/DEAH box helicase [Acidimicrobiales bacterium]|nr:DEAD/DEAH box helicase [Acidimicrobiales bacterium]